MTKKAEDYFHCEGACYNCAQAILKAFQEKFNISDEMIEEYREYGGGRVDDNMCGALFAVMQLIKDRPDQKEAIQKEFAKIIGTTKCKEIKDAQKFSCKECVRLAADLLEKSNK